MTENVNWNIVDTPAIKVKFLKTHEDAILPKVNNNAWATGDSGYDIFCVEDVTIPARGTTVAPVGVTVADISPGYWFRIEPRSGLGFKHNIQPHLGVIDNQYRGDLGVKLYNFSDKDVTIEKGKAVAQFVVYPLVQVDVNWSDEVTETDRGAKGFGSSDSK
jgi:dUTP pyrophosphatase